MRFRYRPEHPSKGDDTLEGRGRKDECTTLPSPLPFPPSSPSRVSKSVEKIKKGLQYFSPPSPPPPAPLPSLSSLRPPVVPSSAPRAVDIHPVPPLSFSIASPILSPALEEVPSLCISPPLRPMASPPIVSILSVAHPTNTTPKEKPEEPPTRHDKGVPLPVRVSEWISACAPLLQVVSLDTCFVIFGLVLLLFSRHFLTLIMLLDALRLMYWDALKKWLLEEDMKAMEKEGAEIEAVMRTGRGNDRRPSRVALEIRENVADVSRHPFEPPPQGRKWSEEKRGEEAPHSMGRRIEAQFHLDNGTSRVPMGSAFPASLLTAPLPSAAPHLPPSSFSRDIRPGTSASPSTLGGASPSMPLVRLALMASMTTATTLKWKWTQCLSMAISISEFLEASYPVRLVCPAVFAVPFVATNSLLCLVLEHSYFFIAVLLTSWLLPFVCLVYSVLTGAQWIVLGGLRLLLQNHFLSPNISGHLCRVLGEEMPSSSDSSAFSSDDEENTHEKAEGEEKEEMTYFWEEESENVSRTRPPCNTSSSSEFSFYSGSSSLSATAIMSGSTTEQHRREANAKIGEETPQSSFFSRSHFLPFGRDKKSLLNAKKDEKRTLPQEDAVKPFPERMETSATRRHSPDLPPSKSRRRGKKHSQRSSHHRSLSVRPFIQALDSTPSMASASTAATNLFLHATKREESKNGVAPPMASKAAKKERRNSVQRSKDGEVCRREGESSAATHPLHKSTVIATTWYREHLRGVLFPPSSFFSSSEESPDENDPCEMYRMRVQLLVIAVALMGLGWQLTHYGRGVPWLFWPFIFPLQILNQLTLAVT